MVTAVVMAIITTVSMISVGNLQMNDAAVISEQTYQAAEAGIQDTLYQLGNNQNFVPSNPETFGGIPVFVTIDRTANPKTILAVATGIGNIIRKLKIAYHISTFGGFSGAAMAGTGSFTLGNNDAINGDVCSLSNINGANGLTIAGNIDVAGVGHQIKNVTVVGKVRADQVQSCNVTGSIEYGSSYLNSQTQNSAAGPYTPCPNGSCTNTFNAASVQCPFPPIPAKFFLEPGDAGYSATSADSFYNSALAGSSSNIIVGNYNVSGSNQKIGPNVIQGDINLGNGSTLTLTGPVWVTGKITSGNGTTIQLDPSSFGAGQSTTLVVDGQVGSGNKTAFVGLPTQKTFLLVASKNSGISIANNTVGAVFYAPSGTVDTGNCPNSGGCPVINNVTANTISLGNNRILTYDNALRDLIVTGSSQKQITVDPGSWSEQ